MKQESRILLVEMHDDVKLQLAGQLAQKLGTLRTRQDTEDGRRKTWNGEQKNRLSDIQDIAGELRSGKVAQPVECGGFIDGDGMFVVKRLDTDEVVERREATDDDRQDDLGLDPPDPPDPSGDQPAQL